MSAAEDVGGETRPTAGRAANRSRFFMRQLGQALAKFLVVHPLADPGAGLLDGLEVVGIT